MGYSVIGYSIIDQKIALLESGIVAFSKKDILSNKLFDCFQFFVSLYKKFKHAFNFVYFVVEKSFFSLNPSSAFILNSFYSIVVFTSRYCDASLLDFTPCEIKKIISGSGSCTKEELFSSIMFYFPNFNEKISYDETDSIAIALAGLLATSFSFDKKF